MGNLFTFDPQEPCRADDEATRCESIATVLAVAGALVIGFALGMTFGRGWM